ncbi:unnamed protein product [Vitrella brassicaformis CCMP3155]|uniref:snRNA-activating protein complex subunit 3 n=2 Tax=Vitrella brassicaformis TaxID=1169539 RepID=A0A0G4EXL1_VITBC|nr:unnamed protein product [Vitrella brassicaformis CCMP3155]|eukprot:CEM03451.1 unnamed protein product [Vitrella brassicaformis CCMP3155]
MGDASGAADPAALQLALPPAVDVEQPDYTRAKFNAEYVLPSELYVAVDSKRRRLLDLAERALEHVPAGAPVDIDPAGARMPSLFEQVESDVRETFESERCRTAYDAYLTELSSDSLQAVAKRKSMERCFRLSDAGGAVGVGGEGGEATLPERLQNERQESVQLESYRLVVENPASHRGSKKVINVLSNSLRHYPYPHLMATHRFRANGQRRSVSPQRALMDSKSEDDCPAGADAAAAADVEVKKEKKGLAIVRVPRTKPPNSKKRPPASAFKNSLPETLTYDPVAISPLIQPTEPAAAGHHQPQHRSPAEDTIVSFAFYHREGFLAQEIDLLGSQTLGDLRDALKCEEDTNFDGARFSMSALFYFDGQFYADARDPVAVDYSVWLRPWIDKQAAHKGGRKGAVDDGGSEDSNSNQGGDDANDTLFDREQQGLIDAAGRPTKTMHETRLADASFGVQAQGMFLHQGECEHRIVVTNVRVRGPHDCPYDDAYPINTFLAETRFRKCQVCNVNVSELMLVKERRVETNPAFMCHNCYVMLDQDEHGNRRHMMQQGASGGKEATKKQRIVYNYRQNAGCL